METINTESVISSLIYVGFDKVDSILFTYSLAQLSYYDENKNFIFEDREVSQNFKKYIDYNGTSFQLKEGLSLDTQVSNNGKVFKPLKNSLNTNENLVNCFNEFDFTDIVLKKAEFYNVENIEEIDKSRFSDKEIEIIKDSSTRKGKVLS